MMGCYGLQSGFFPSAAIRLYASGGAVSLGLDPI